MVTFAIPYFRMDKTGFDYESMQLEKMGVKFAFNTVLGRDFTIAKLNQEFDSIVLAIGMSKSKTLDLIETNVPASKRMDALSFLKSYNQKETVWVEGAVILIIGGGNSAIDTARSAKKLSSKNRVIISCVETAEKIPAFAEEVKHAIEEGVEIIYDSYLESLSAKKNGEIKSNLHSFSSKKFLVPVECDYIITAIGQTSDLSALENLNKDENGRVENTESVSKSQPVFIAGDIRSGNHMSVIGAIASGKKAAIEVRKLLENYPFEFEGAIALERLNSNPTPAKRVHDDSDDGFDIERYNLFQSCKKCNHCIDNFGCPAMVKVNGKVEINTNRCTLCGLCIDVCPNNAIKWEEVKEEKTIAEIVR